MGDNSPKLLDFMVKKEKECLGVGNEEKIRHGSSISSSCDENKLELRLGLPYDENKQNKQGFIRSPISLSHFNNNNGGKWSSSSSFGYKQLSVMEKNASQPCYTRIVDLQKTENTPSANTAVPNISQKRVVPTPVVGWPPIRSFRKNLASSSSAKSGGDPQNVNPSKPVNEKKPIENSIKSLFVKINMDGVPIGRKVDLSACNCYENLSSAVDTLFRGLLAAQQDSSGGGIENMREEQKPITGLLDGTGEYTLVYEDNEGDRMLVGDVPWNMFVSTVKRLRVLKSSDLPTLSRGSKQGKER